MPTHETWLDDHIIATEWKQPLTADELDTCFRSLKTMLDTTEHPVHILFDIQQAGTIPAQAPGPGDSRQIFGGAGTG